MSQKTPFWYASLRLLLHDCFKSTWEETVLKMLHLLFPCPQLHVLPSLLCQRAFIQCVTNWVRKPIQPKPALNNTNNNKREQKISYRRVRAWWFRQASFWLCNHILGKTQDELFSRDIYFTLPIKEALPVGLWQTPNQRQLKRKKPSPKKSYLCKLLWMEVGLCFSKVFTYHSLWLSIFLPFFTVSIGKDN